MFICPPFQGMRRHNLHYINDLKESPYFYQLRREVHGMCVIEVYVAPLLLLSVQPSHSTRLVSVPKVNDGIHRQC